VYCLSPSKNVCTIHVLSSELCCCSMDLSVLRDSNCKLLYSIYCLLTYKVIASRSQRVSLIVIPFCLSVCLDVCRSFRDLQPTTIDRSQPNLVGRSCPRTRVSLFGSPIFHTFGARGKNMQNFAYFQHVDSGYYCHYERDASCHMTCTVTLQYFDTVG